MSSSRPHIGWIGLGRMGTRMADRLIDAGHTIAAYNRTPSKIAQWRTDHVNPVGTPAELADCEVVFITVSGPADLLAVTTGPGGLFSGGGTGPDRTIVDCSTVSPQASAETRDAAEQAGWNFVAAPISGNPDVVAAGGACVVASGPRESFDRVSTLLETIARAAVYAGQGEVARLAKLGHNLLLGLITQSLGEVLALMDKAGIEREAFFEFLGNTVLSSKFITAKSGPLISRDYQPPTFTTTLLRKDFDLGLEQARELGVPLPLAAVTRELIQSCIGLGHGQDDFSALYELQALVSDLPAREA
ncbi:NAD(P)-dependent oxidoreductase [Sciscionella marina]|uniref:NAD(P)-dependent oxidoreductase n=1 Tax=Sciscionella marina TaxID=508770 RepID=UPI00037EF187|nr:NAD(P)-dependent oxidoreductase [Sciscionella marina]